jgi:uncharacterized protein involved in exopolysaccharide biosynthesis
MTIELTKEEKIQIINNHIKNLKSNKYNLELSVIEEGSIEEPGSDKIANLNKEISDTNDRISALEAEIAKL